MSSDMKGNEKNLHQERLTFKKTELSCQQTS